MAGYHGGQYVKGGYYLKRGTGEFKQLEEGDLLPGNEETKYTRIPLPAVMALGSFMGLAYAIAVPILYCLAFIYSLARLMFQKLKNLRHSHSVFNEAF